MSKSNKRGHQYDSQGRRHRARSLYFVDGFSYWMENYIHGKLGGLSEYQYTGNEKVKKYHLNIR